jgi:hypothetical protein
LSECGGVGRALVFLGIEFSIFDFEKMKMLKCSKRDGFVDSYSEYI